jgi:hypothetical protein
MLLKGVQCMLKRHSRSEEVVEMILRAAGEGWRHFSAAWLAW